MFLKQSMRGKLKETIRNMVQIKDTTLLNTTPGPSIFNFWEKGGENSVKGVYIFIFQKYMIFLWLLLKFSMISADFLLTQIRFQIRFMKRIQVAKMKRIETETLVLGKLLTWADDVSVLMTDPLYPLLAPRPLAKGVAGAPPPRPRPPRPRGV